MAEVIDLIPRPTPYKRGLVTFDNVPVSAESAVLILGRQITCGNSFAALASQDSP